jgi:general secretion pathway protein D
MRTCRVLALFLSLFLAGCAAQPAGFPGMDFGGESEAGAPVPADDSGRPYLQRVFELRKEARQPGDPELRRAEEEAAAYYLKAGSALARQDRHAEAIEKFELGLAAQPGNAMLLQARQAAAGRREAARLLAEGRHANAAGNTGLAETLFQQAAAAGGTNPDVKRELDGISRARKEYAERYVLAAFRSGAPVALNFREARLGDALKVLCDGHDLNAVFDKGAENYTVSVSARNVTFEQGFHMLLQAGNAAFKVTGPNSVFIYENTPEKHQQFAGRYFRTFHLSTVKAERMAEILKASMELKTIVANNDLGTIQIRDTRETLDVAEKLIAANDRKPAEIMLDVSILEVDRNKAEQLGIDYGSQITLQAPKFTVKELTGANVLNSSVITVPPVTLNYLKTSVNARVLSNPRVRTIDGMPAKIHVGDRVPLQSAAIQDVTGQVRTTYEYHDLGIRLDVVPKYHLDNTVFVDMTIEVSSLGQNLGTAAQPAFAIGTRNVHTAMLLREGETAVLGGLISEQDSTSLAQVPGLGEAGILGRLFSTTNEKGQRTELLLTVTPHLLRAQALPSRSNIDFYSGTGGTYSTRSESDYLQRQPDSGTPPRYRINLDNASQTGMQGAWTPQNTGGLRAERAGR